MSAFRQVPRVLNRGFINTISKRGYADKSDEMKFTFAAANEVYYDSKIVKQVDVPSFSGSFGILPKHVPTLAVLKPGIVTIFENEKVVKYFVSSGTVTINDDNSVQVLAEEAHPLDRFDSGTIREIMNEAQNALSKANTDQLRAEALIAVEVAEELHRSIA